MNRCVLVCTVWMLALAGCGPVAVEDEMGYRTQAISRFRAGQYDDARVLLELALFRNPSDPVSLYWLGRVACEKADWEQAIYRFQSCLSVDPGHPQARAWLLRAEEASGAVGQQLRFIPLPPARSPIVAPGE